MPSTVIELGLTLAGDVNTFDAAQQSSLSLTHQQQLFCYQPVCFLQLRVSSASVRVDAVLTIPDDPPNAPTLGATGAGSAAMVATAVESAATALVARPAAQITSALGVSVETAAPVSVGHAVVPLVVAPPPPSPPLPLSLIHI